MKIIKNIIRSMMIVMLSILIFSCSDGEDGAIGPAGQDGQDGVGIDGTDGIDGIDGPPGTANVIYSDWIPENFIGGPDTEKLMSLESFGLLDDFSRETDAILVYGRASVGILGTVYELPYFNVGDDEFYSIRFAAGIGFQTITIEAQSTDGANKDFEFFDDFRYVIIPGGVSANPTSSAAKSARDYSSMSYEEVRALFNIPE